MASRTTTIKKLPMSDAERKAKQRLADRLAQKASAELINQEIVKVFRNSCLSLSSKIIRREPNLGELAIMIAHEFPEDERSKVYDYLGFQKAE